jgi:hypothetical protein
MNLLSGAFELLILASELLIIVLKLFRLVCRSIFVTGTPYPAQLLYILKLTG